MASKRKQQEVVSKESTPEEVASAFEEFVKKAKEKYGESALVHPSDDEFPDTSEAIPTGIIGVDRATRIGGIPKGRITEIYGPESSGKTTLMLHIVNSAQKIGLKNILILDVEYTLTGERLKACGIDPSVVIARPESGEEALDMAYDALVNGADLVCIDSVAGLVPTSELSSTMEDSSIALQARMMSKFLRKANPVVGREGRTLVFTNQIRSSASQYGPSEITTGGNALRFYASMRIELRRKETLKSGSESYANIVRVRAVKSKVDSPYGEDEFIMFFDPQKTPAASLISTGEKLGIIKRKGSWYTYGDISLGSGLMSSVNKLLEDQNLFNEIDSKLRDPEVLTKKIFEQNDI